MTKKVKIGNLYIGGGESIKIQSMSTGKISSVENAVNECLRLRSAGCDIMRFSVNDEEDAKSFKEVKKRVDMPLVADIHFDYKLALKAIEGGADKIRINPGNIGSENNVKEVATALKRNGLPVRVGSNTGSIDKEFLAKYGKNEISLGESALKNVAILEKYGVKDIVISVKASGVPLMIKAYEYVSKKTDYPLHLGVTEAGTYSSAVVKNSIGIGVLLNEGIGDTIRVSISGDTVKEVESARAILSALEIKKDCVNVIACPTCGRCEWNCMGFAEKVSDYVKAINKPLQIAVMGCAVNGPGEAKDANLGVAGAGNGECVIFSNGKIVKKVKEEELGEVFFREIDKCLL